MKKYILTLLTITLVFQAFSQDISTLQRNKISQVLSKLSTTYVDSINDEKLIESTIKSMLENLDPHSTYTPASEVERMQEKLVGSFDGIGVQFQIIKDTINVVQTITGTPAEKVGVLMGDKIVEIEDSIVAGVNIKNLDVIKKLRGKRGTSVNIKVKRNNQKELIDFKIIRDKIPLNSVDASYMVADSIGYIKINSFGAKTLDEFKNGLIKLQSQGMKKLIVDLQHNGGGYLGTAIGLADEFLGNNQLVVYTEGEHSPRKEAKASFWGNFEEGKLAILVDQYSASASEILSGAIQDWDRGIIIGRRTFGKGLVQKEINLLDNSIIRLTIARYYTPSGRCIQKSYKSGLKDYKKDLENRYNKGELMHADSVHLPDSLKYQTLISKRTVYAGGGIMPDIFVPIDTTDFSLYHQEIIAKGVLNATILNYCKKNDKTLKKKYDTFQKFEQDYKIPKQLISKLIEEAKKEKIEFNEKEFKRSKRLIYIQIKALIARAIWGNEEYFQIIDCENQPLQKAIEVLKDNKHYYSILSK